MNIRSVAIGSSMDDLVSISFLCLVTKEMWEKIKILFNCTL